MFIIPEPGADHPRAHYDKLFPLPEFEHLQAGEPDVAFLMRTFPHTSQGRQIIGACCQPSVQGRMSKVFDWMVEDKFGTNPDFLFIFDLDWWTEATPLEREILTYHEMCHAGQAKGRYGVPQFHRQTGKPIWAIVGHDVEEFTAVVTKYGAWQPEIVAFVAAVNQSSRFNHE